LGALYQLERKRVANAIAKKNCQNAKIVDGFAQNGNPLDRLRNTAPCRLVSNSAPLSPRPRAPDCFRAVSIVSLAD
jgi:hypothetical protein